MDRILLMIDDIHKLKKQMDIIFQNIEKSGDSDSEYKIADAYADKERAIDLLSSLTTRMNEADMANVTALPREDETPETIQGLKNRILELEKERSNLNRKAGASLKGII